MTEIAITGAAAVVDDRLGALPETIRSRAARVERVTQLALAAAGHALAEAGLAVTDGPPRPRMGVALGTAFGCFVTNAAYQRRVAADGPKVASPRLFSATVSNAAAGEIGIGYRLGGPAVTLTAGGAAGPGGGAPPPGPGPPPRAGARGARRGGAGGAPRPR